MSPPAVPGLRQDERGASAILIALTLTTLLALVALGIDSTRGLIEKRRLQRSADAAALAGAMALRGRQPVEPAARAVAAGNLSGRLGRFEAANPPRSGAWRGDARAVEVVLRRDGRHLLAGFLGEGPEREVAARAVALVEPVKGCPSSASGQVDQGLSLIDILPCLSGVPGQGGAPPQPPMAGGGRPWANGCTHVDFVASGRREFPPGAVNFCGTTRVPAGGTLVLGAGNHQIWGDIRVEAGGRLEVRGGAMLLWGTLRATAESEVSLVAAKSGDLAGIAAVSLLGGSSRLDGDGRHHISGMLLLPFQQLTLALLKQSSCVTLAFAGLSTIHRRDFQFGCDPEAAPVAQRVRLVE